MPILEGRSYREGAERPASYVNSVLLAANVPEVFTVPKDNQTQKYAAFLRLSASDTVYLKLLKSGFDSDVVTNGAFAADTDWTKGTGWTIAAGVADAAGAISTALTQTVSNLIEGQTYYVTYTATRSAGTVTVQVGGTAGTGRTTSATFSEFIVAGSNGTVGFTTSGFTGTVDDFSVIPAAQVPGDVTTGFAAELYNKEKAHNILLDGTVTKVSVVSAGTPIVTAGFSL